MFRALYLFISLSVMCSLTAQETRWTPWVQVELDGSTSSSLAREKLEVFFPICQKPNKSLLFSYLQGTKYEELFLTEVAGGVGARKQMNKNWVGGVNLSYNGLLSENNNWFNFIDMEAEWFFLQLDARFNARIPFGIRQKEFSRGPRVVSTTIINSQVLLNTGLRSQDVASWSLGGELGWRFPIYSAKKFCGFGRVYVGGQWCDKNTEGTEGINCATLGFELTNQELHRARENLQVTFGVEICTDFQHEIAGVLSFTFRQALKKCPPKYGCRKLTLLSRIDAPITRRLRPCVSKKSGKIINEAVMTK